jgi:hypothetical protein
MTANQIIWTQLGNESPDERVARLNKELHRIFFEGKACNEICPGNWFEPTHDIICRICGARAVKGGYELEHGTPRFLESLDAMQLIVESGRFAEVREEFYHWLASEGKPAYECAIFLYNNPQQSTRFAKRGNTRQEAFYVTALKAMGFEVVQESQGEDNV